MIIKRGAIVLLLIIFCSAAVSAKSKSKNRSKSLTNAKIILIHGFVPLVIKDEIDGDAALQQVSFGYWQDFWLAKSSHNIFWDSKKRIAQNREHVLNQLESIYQSGSCSEGCIFVTHSTGDLVLRDLLLLWQHRFFESVFPHLAWLLRIDGTGGGYIGSYLRNYVETAPYYSDQFKLLGSMDFAGAGGGTELADQAISVVTRYHETPKWRRWFWWRRADINALNAQFGKIPTREEMGVQLDLQTSEARSIAIANSPIPRLRFVGGGRLDAGHGNLYNKVLLFVAGRRVEKILPGMDDSVIAAHSACGVNRRGTYDSCFSNIYPSGLVQQVNKAPQAFYQNHFPLFMGESYDHLDLIDGGGHGKITSRLGGYGQRLSPYLIYNVANQRLGGLRFQNKNFIFATVQNSDNINMGDLLLDRLKLKKAN